MPRLRLDLSTPAQETEIILIPASRIRRYERQPRRYFDPESLAALSASIRNDGQQDAIKVARLQTERSSDHPFILIDGERRWRAGQMIAQDFPMKCVIKPVKTEHELFRLSTIANCHRDDMQPLEKARAWKRLHEENGMTYEQIAEAVGVSVSTVDQYLQLFKLSDAVLKLMDPERPEDQHLLLSAAREIAHIPDHNLQLELAKEVVRQGMPITMARPYIQERAERAGYRIGGSKRSSWDDYRAFRTFIGSIRQRAARFLKAGIARMYRFRDNNEVLYDARQLRETIESLEALEVELKEALGYLNKTYAELLDQRRKAS